MSKLNLFECPSWDALITRHGCQSLQRLGNATASKILASGSVMLVPEEAFYKLRGCTLCKNFKPKFDIEALDKLIKESYILCNNKLKGTDSVDDGKSRYKRWYDKHGKEDKQKRRATKKGGKKNDTKI